MVLKNPLLLVTIPLALALSLIWFRRKKIHCDSGGDKGSTSDKTINPNFESNSEKIEPRIDLKHSISMPIESTPMKRSSLALNNNDSFDFKFGKSAPIDITPHKTSPTRSKNGSNESDKNKDDGSEYKALNSIEENSVESVDLPGSIDCRRRFSFTIKTNEPAVVVKASTMDVNKSPQSSFETLNTSPPSNAPAPVSIKTTPSANKSAKNSEKKSKAGKQSNANDVASDKGVKKQERVLPVASPPLSLCSNKSNQSHDSGDSGKGSSPANSEGGQTLSSIQSYDFELPQTIVGCLVGKNGVTVKKIRDECNVNIMIKRHPIKHRKYKLCTVQGTQQQIDTALAMIKSKMPHKMNLERVDIENETAEMLAAISQIDSNRLQLNLIDGINNDVAVCAVINGGHLFLQQPLHPSYMSLNVLQNCMNQSYSSFESPVLPNFSIGTVCVGQIDGHWYRYQIIDYTPGATTCVAKYLDFGGYCEIQTTELRQIRTDFMTVPFQAIECLLGDIKPKGGEWCIEASQAIVELTQYRTIQAQITNYTETGVPEVHLYSFLSPNNVVFINQELVARNYAEWCEPTVSA
ncbi:A-kinase anchor protein 1, mitochondrial [Contarinia nasturtii]|uniref:A-kinase anchor protein 1, mitochondrial n=1 Tax=Contarinia nasturtii TaxID=265458 RepID=UPI0012D463E0|nr:A-kinase anchor protein 1, mitochondrial [Contarinia nasturtii]XP_031627995.1 A-kinase anchor protein 1, mitochondrial [Contarinia nasturtii]XP_031627996.1 A-kinase anchor protein 1, mitochondrial [Contarinia nasturtii]